MAQKYQFVENLIQLRSHYKSLVEDAERYSSHATEQLNHINALLVDQLVEKQQFVDNLVQLRWSLREPPKASHYQSRYSQQQQKANSAKQQLIHVNALLADQVVLQHNQQQPYSIQAATLEQQALFGAITERSESPPPPSLEIADPPESSQVSEQPTLSDISQGAQDEDNPELQESEALEASQQQMSSEHSQVEQQTEHERSLLGKPAASPLSRRAAPLKTPLLPQYQHLTKSEAIEKLLHEHRVLCCILTT